MNLQNLIGILPWIAILYLGIAVGTIDVLNQKLKKEGTKITSQVKISVTIAGLFWFVTLTIWFISAMYELIESRRKK